MILVSTIRFSDMPDLVCGKLHCIVGEMQDYKLLSNVDISFGLNKSRFTILVSTSVGKI